MGMGGYYSSDGFVFRVEDFVDLWKVLFVIGVLVAVANAMNSVIPVTMFLYIVPLFYLVITVIVVVGVLTVATEYGALFVIGWTIASLLLGAVGLISIWEVLLDLVPIALIVLKVWDGSDSMSGGLLTL